MSIASQDNADWGLIVEHVINGSSIPTLDANRVRCINQTERRRGDRHRFEDRSEPAEAVEWGAELPETSVVGFGRVLRKRTPHLRNLRKERSEVFCGYPQMRSSSEEGETQ